MLPGTRQQKNWFFIAVTPAVRLNTYNLPNQATYENLVSSAAFILNSEDSADVAQTQQGLVLKSIAADILAASDVKTLGFGNLALSVSPMQLPTVALTGGTVVVTQNMTTGALLYTLPEYLLASDGDVTITDPSSGQILKYNGSVWINANLYYQTIINGAGFNMAQEPALKFSNYFAVTDNAGTSTGITITTNGITYSLMQQTSGGAVLLGNSTGSAANISEQTVGTGLTLSGGSLTLTTNGITYAKLQKSVYGFVMLANPIAGAQTYQEVGLSPSLAFDSSTSGFYAYQLDIAVNGITYAQIQQTSGGNVLIGNSTGSAANISEITVAGLQLTGGILASNTYKKVTAATYNVLLTDFNGVILGFSYSSTGTIAVTMCNPALVTPGLKLSLKDISGAAGTHNITINPFSGETFDGAATLVISANYGKDTLLCDGTNWFTI